MKQWNWRYDIRKTSAGGEKNTADNYKGKTKDADKIQLRVCQVCYQILLFNIFLFNTYFFPSLSSVSAIHVCFLPGCQPVCERWNGWDSGRTDPCHEEGVPTTPTVQRESVRVLPEPSQKQPARSPLLFSGNITILNSLKSSKFQVMSSYQYTNFLFIPI